MTYRFRSAITGLFVSVAYAMRHAASTIRERIRGKRK